MSTRRLKHPVFSRFLLLGILLVVTLSTFAATAEDDAGRYQIAQRWALPGPGGSDFLLVSEKDHRLYISRDTQLTILDTNEGKPIGEIRDLTDVRGVAVDPDGKVGYIADGISGSVKVFNVPTLKVLTSINIGGTPDAIAFEPFTKRIFAFDSHNKVAVVLDSKSLQTIASIKLPGRPGAAVPDGKGAVFVNLESTSQLARIDARTLNTPTLVSLSPCVGPSGMAMDPERARVFSACENKLVAVSDGTTGQLVATVPVGEGAKTVGFDTKTGLAFSANGEGTLTVIKEDSASRFSPVQTLKTEPGARTMAFDQEHQQLYLFTSRFGQRTGPTSEELQFRPTPVPGSAVLLVIRP